ncbi:MAG: DNA-processing protein DprA [Firmicutes bacterium]|nr:DNA-processing protein DprA [Bacillota bacterium]
MDSQRLPFLLAFNSLTRLKAVETKAILEYYDGDAREAWLHPADWGRVAVLSPGAEAGLLEQVRALDPDALFTEWLNSGCRATVLGDDDYPRLLQQIYDPPLLLFYHGSLPRPEDITLAMIGSRQASSYGRQVAEIFARDLAAQGGVIVSGMARGVDGISHRAALDAGGRTVAVLGSGLDVIYPPEHDRLYADICGQGAVISEFPLGTEALPYNFPRRNRLISGLSRGVIVVEAGAKSGTLRTVDFALEQGRDVFCVPGNVTSSTSRGTNRLLKEGAAEMMTCAEDVWRHYSDAPLVAAAPPARRGPTEDAEDRRLLLALKEPHRADELIAAGLTQLDIAQLQSRLTLLEISGRIRQLPGKYYQTVIRSIRA